MIAVLSSYIAIPIMVGLIVLPSLNAHAVNSRSIDLITCDNGDIAKWNKSTLKYFIDNSANAKPAVVDAIRNGVEEWNNIGQSEYTLSETTTKSKADVTINTVLRISPRFVLGATDVSCASDVRGIMHATMFVRTKGLSPTIIQNIAAHETGHALGLGHSELNQDLMFPSFDRQEVVNLVCPSNLDAGGLSASASPFSVRDSTRVVSC
jgi:matrixin